MGGADLSPDYSPSEDEPFMNERQRAYFRKKLFTWREEILRESKETLDYLQDSEQHPDITDRASYESDRGIELTVADEGTGIQEELLSKIFTPRFSTKSSRSGLGLHIVASIVKGNGGTVTAANRETGKGAVFTIRLPGG